MTKEAQNALLKTLEEPPGNSLIILTTPHKTELLPTIISRCQLEKMTRKEGDKPEKDAKIKKLYQKLRNQSRGERLGWADKNKEKISAKEDAIQYISVWSKELRNELIENPQKQEIKNGLKESLELLKNLKTTNVSPRLSVEKFLLKLPLNNK